MSSHDPMGIPDARSFLKAFHAAQFWANMRIFFGLLARVLSICVWPAHYQIVHRFIDHYVNVAMQREHRREPPLSGAKDDMETTHQRRSLISSLVEQTNDRNEIRWQVIQGLMAMQNTTSTLISNTLFSLSRNPSIWERLRANVKDLNADVMTATTLSQTTLLQNVLKECKSSKALSEMWLPANYFHSSPSLPRIWTVRPNSAERYCSACRWWSQRLRANIRGRRFSAHEQLLRSTPPDSGFWRRSRLLQSGSVEPHRS